MLVLIFQKNLEVDFFYLLPLIKFLLCDIFIIELICNNLFINLYNLKNIFFINSNLSDRIR